MTTIEDKIWRWFQMYVVSTICLYLADEVVIHILNATFHATGKAR